ncbi:MAG: hypothetical protein J7J65_04010 [Candidatus Korarchaeota archaeon]|nr:hypothetical protein [Candidatus Korarchaeota archaeon]
MRVGDPVRIISRVLNDLGIEDYARVLSSGRLLRIEIRYDPLKEERERLILLKKKLHTIRRDRDSVRDHLIQQIDYLIDRLNKVSFERVLVSVATTDGITKIQKQLSLIQREMTEKQSQAVEIRKLIRSLSSYIREYVRNSQ